MLGVRPEYQNHGLGRRLKLKQRDLALAAGIKLIEWTFDPLELKNAFFNIERLGAIVRRYAPNNYGLTSSPLHGGLPTDRCNAEWWVDSERVREVLKSSAASRQLTAESAVACAGIAYPADIARIRSENQPAAREIQQANAEKFEKAFAQGLAVIRFARRRSYPRRPERAVLPAFSRSSRLNGRAHACPPEPMKIERITLRHISMPLVHFFETSFGRTYPSQHGPGRSPVRRTLRLGRSHRRREPLLQRGVDRIRLAHRPRLRRPPRH